MPVPKMMSLANNTGGMGHPVSTKKYGIGTNGELLKDGKPPIANDEHGDTQLAEEAASLIAASGGTVDRAAIEQSFEEKYALYHTTKGRMGEIIDAAFQTAVRLGERQQQPTAAAAAAPNVLGRRNLVLSTGAAAAGAAVIRPSPACTVAPPTTHKAEEYEEMEEEDAVIEEMEVDEQQNGGTNNGTAAAAAEGQLAALAQARNDLAQSRDDLVQARNEITQSRDALAQARNEITQSRAALTLAHNETTQSRDDLAEARNDLAKVAAMITDLGGDLSEAYGEVVKAVDKNEAKNDELDEVPARVSALEEELAEVRRSYKVLLDNQQLGEGVLV